MLEFSFFVGIDRDRPSAGFLSFCDGYAAINTQNRASNPAAISNVNVTRIWVAKRGKLFMLLRQAQSLLRTARIWPLPLFLHADDEVIDEDKNGLLARLVSYYVIKGLYKHSRLINVSLGKRWGSKAFERHINNRNHFRSSLFSNQSTTAPPFSKQSTVVWRFSQMPLSQFL